MYSDEQYSSMMKRYIDMITSIIDNINSKEDITIEQQRKEVSKAVMNSIQEVAKMDQHIIEE